MIRDLLDSWELFARAYATGWIAAALLAFLGVYLVARDQVFLGAVLGQAAACGVAVAGALGVAVLPCGVGFALATVLLAVGPGARRRPGGTALGAWFAVLGAGAIVAASKNPHGKEEIEHLLTSSLLGASGEHVWTLAALAVVALPAGFAMRGRILLCVLDPDCAHAQGLRPGLVLGLLAVGWAVGAGVAIHAAGLLFAFGMLVLPAMLARRVCRSARATLLVAPAAALLATTVAYVLALGWDLPPGPLAVVVLGVALGVCPTKRRTDSY